MPESDARSLVSTVCQCARQFAFLLKVNRSKLYISDPTENIALKPCNENNLPIHRGKKKEKEH